MAYIVVGWCLAGLLVLALAAAVMRGGAKLR
jgi:hypothetical protein